MRLKFAPPPHPPPSPRSAASVAAVTALALSVLFPAVAAAQGVTLPSILDPASPNAASLKTLYDIIFYLGLAVFLLVEGLIVIAIVRFRRREGDPEPAQVHGNGTAEIAWTIAPTVVVLILAIVSYRPLVEGRTPPADAITVNAIGHQWWWEFAYPDAGVTTATDLVVPVGRPIRVNLDSVDVIHSFWVPQLSGKTDAIPGARDGGAGQNSVWFVAERPGRYEGQCAELCGAQHAGMRFAVVVVGEAEYRAWLVAQAAPAARPAPGSPEAAGQAVMTTDEKLCYTCHTIDGVPKMVGTAGPNLTHVGTRPWLAGGVFPNSAEGLTRWVDHPDDVKPGTVMPDVGLAPGEIRSVVSYLQSLK